MLRVGFCSCPHPKVGVHPDAFPCFKVGVLALEVTCWCHLSWQIVLSEPWNVEKNTICKGPRPPQLDPGCLKSSSSLSMSKAAETKRFPALGCFTDCRVRCCILNQGLSLELAGEKGCWSILGAYWGASSSSYRQQIFSRHKSAFLLNSREHSRFTPTMCLSPTHPFCTGGTVLDLPNFLEIGCKGRLQPLVPVSSPALSVCGFATSPCQGKPHSLFSYRRKRQRDGRGIEPHSRSFLWDSDLWQLFLAHVTCYTEMMSDGEHVCAVPS